MIGAECKDRARFLPLIFRKRDGGPARTRVSLKVSVASRPGQMPMPSSSCCNSTSSEEKSTVWIVVEIDKLQVWMNCLQSRKARQQPA